MNELPWSERVPTISINPDMATRDDIARLASELMDALQKLSGHEIAAAMMLEQMEKLRLRGNQNPTGQQLAALMVKHALVDSAAIDDPEGYDNFQTLEGINAIARELRQLNEKVRKG